jgi:hypothetical protein
MCFGPKGDEPGDNLEVVRDAADVRPLNLKNTDNKIITGANIRPFKPYATSHTHKYQRGFVPGRNFLSNVVDLDSAARLYSLYATGRFFSDVPKSEPLPAGKTSLIPVLPFFDFAAAFPSVIHRWIFLAIERRGFPYWFRSLIKCIYHRAAAFSPAASGTVLLFHFARGVLQGCPASAFLFTMALDPFLFLFEKGLSLSKGGIMRACADDLGAALRRLSALKVLFPVFSLAKAAAGLNLKPIKCVLVPLVPLDDAIKHLIKGWLTKHIPEWKDFYVKDAGNYLGFFSWPCGRFPTMVGPSWKIYR